MPMFKIKTDPIIPGAWILVGPCAYSGKPVIYGSSRDVFALVARRRFLLGEPTL